MSELQYYPIVEGGRIHFVSFESSSSYSMELSNQLTASIADAMTISLMLYVISSLVY